MNDQELVKRVVAMLTELRGLGGADRVYIFSPFYKPVAIDMSTLFGALINFPDWSDFSHDKVQGFKQICNKYSDILSGYVRIGGHRNEEGKIVGDNVYQAREDHEYKLLPETKGRELIKALVSRAMKVGRFDLSMMNPGWLGDEDEHKDVEVPQHKMKEAEGDEELPVHNVSHDPDDAVRTALQMLNSVFGPFEHNDMQVQEMEEMLEDAVAPYHIELTPSKDGIQIAGQNNVGVALYNNDGELYWEF